MKYFSTGWFDTLQSNIEANCNARVTRNFKEVRIDWTVIMKLKDGSQSIAQENYIDIIVNGGTVAGEDTQRIKSTDEEWTGTAEHTINGVLTFEEESSGSLTLMFTSVSNFSQPDVFRDIQLDIEYDVYNPSERPETQMPFHSVFTTEEYLKNHKGLIPRNIVCNYKSKYVLRYNEYKIINRKFK